MKKPINSTIKAHLVRGAFYVLLLLAVCVIPFALAQRTTTENSSPSPAPTPHARAAASIPPERPPAIAKPTIPPGRPAAITRPTIPPAQGATTRGQLIKVVVMGRQAHQKLAGNADYRAAVLAENKTKVRRMLVAAGAPRNLVVEFKGRPKGPGTPVELPPWCVYTNAEGQTIIVYCTYFSHCPCGASGASPW